MLLTLKGDDWEKRGKTKDITIYRSNEHIKAPDGTELLNLITQSND